MSNLTPISSLLKRKIESPISALEKDFMCLLRVSKSDEIYSNFDNTLHTYSNKIKNQPSSICNALLARKNIYLALLMSSNINILGSYVIDSNKLNGIILNTGVLDIDIKTGDVSAPDDLIYIIYFQFIRAVVDLNSKDIQNDMDLNSLLVDYYTFLLMKNMKLPLLNDKQLELFKFITGAMFFKYFYKDNDALAIEKCQNIVAPDSYSEFKQAIRNSSFSKFEDIKDIIKLIGEFKISFDPPNQLLYQLLLNIKSLGFLLISSDIGNIIAASIVSLYTSEYYSPLFINRQTQNKIESLISKYFSKVEFGQI